MSAELHVPQAAIDALEHVHNTYGDLEADVQVRAIATPVVVHELLRIAGRAEIIAAKPDAHPGVARVMESMASALRGSAGDLEDAYWMDGSA